VSQTHNQDLITVSDTVALGEPLPMKGDLARHFRVSVRTIDRWTLERKIPHIRLGRRCIRYQWPAVKKAVARMIIQEVK
jgi:hypothetical protein